MYEQGGAPQPPQQSQPQQPQPQGSYPGYAPAPTYPPSQASMGGSGIERNIFTILKVLGWGALALCLISALTLCGISIAESGDLSRAGVTGSNFVWIRGMVTALVVGLIGALLWAFSAALGIILENQSRGRR
jgi:hypothetical protein